MIFFFLLRHKQSCGKYYQCSICNLRFSRKEVLKGTSRRTRLFAKGSIVLGMAAEYLMLLSSGYNSTFEAFTMAREFLALTVVRNIPLAAIRTILRYIADRLRSENTDIYRKIVRQRTSLLPV